MLDVTIIGAGPAGSASAIFLARRGYSVLLLEAKRYPLHKLCGEFLSMESIDLLRRLNVLQKLEAAGARPMRSVRISPAHGGSFSCPLPGTALGVSRKAMDALLAGEAERAGADVRMGTPVRLVNGMLGDGFEVATRHETFRSRAVIGAFGKRSRLDGVMDRPFVKEKSSLVAFKAHYGGLDLGETVELYTFRGGYCGLAPVEDGRTNVCWIARAEDLKSAGGDPDAMIAEMLRENTELAHRFNRLQRVVEDFSAAAQVSFTVKGAFARDVCMVGDAAAMIAPLCGDGMAMALRSAELASEALDGYLSGSANATDLKSQYAIAWRREFGFRLRLGSWVHAILSRPALAGMGVTACRLAPPLGRWVVRATRG